MLVGSFWRVAGSSSSVSSSAPRLSLLARSCSATTARRLARPLSTSISHRSDVPPSSLPSLDFDSTRPANTAASAVDPMDLSLADIIRKTIDATGPMPLARYMTLCLAHPTLGYYTRGDVFGRKGDFITSPEISQVFGELLAIYCITRWQAQGSPPKIRLLELGPGRGTLMADMLRTLTTFPAIAKALQAIDLVEMSPVMRELQSAKLRSPGPLPEAVELRWHDRVEDVPMLGDTFTFFVAHEFFDALPVHLLERTRIVPEDEEKSDSTTSKPPSSSSKGNVSSPGGAPFHELLVSYTPPSLDLHFVLSPKSTSHSSYLPTTSPHLTTDVPEGGRVEVCPSAFSIMSVLGDLVGGNAKEASGGGAGLVIDYGDDRANGESFRAFKDHAAVSPFAAPGQADLTTNVDFRYLRHALAHTPAPSSSSSDSPRHPPRPRALGPMTQADFLEALGLWPRVWELVKKGQGGAEGSRSIREGAERLVDLEGMGGEYRVMAVEGGKMGAEAKEEDVYPFGMKIE